MTVYTTPTGYVVCSAVPYTIGSKGYKLHIPTANRLKLRCQALYEKPVISDIFQELWQQISKLGKAVSNGAIILVVRRKISPNDKSRRVTVMMIFEPVSSDISHSQRQCAYIYSRYPYLTLADHDDTHILPEPCNSLWKNTDPKR